MSVLPTRLRSMSPILVAGGKIPAAKLMAATSEQAVKREVNTVVASVTTELFRVCGAELHQSANDLITDARKLSAQSGTTEAASLDKLRELYCSVYAATGNQYGKIAVALIILLAREANDNKKVEDLTPFLLTTGDDHLKINLRVVGYDALRSVVVARAMSPKTSPAP